MRSHLVMALDCGSSSGEFNSRRTPQAARGEVASRAVGDREIAGSIPAELTKERSLRLIYCQIGRAGASSLPKENKHHGADTQNLGPLAGL